MVVCFTIGKTLPLVVPVSQEGLLAFCTDKMLHMPVLPKSGNNSFLYWPPASSADRDAHLIMAPQAVQLVQLVGSVAGPGPHLPGTGGELLATPRTVEVVRMVNLPTESQRLTVNN